MAYYLGNPLLNPAVLVFLVLVAPWQWAATRVVIGSLVVIGGAATVAWFIDRRGGPADLSPTITGSADGDDPDSGDPGRLRPAPARFGRALVRMVLVILPEYAAVVMAVGACRGWLLDLAPGNGSTLPATALMPLLVAVLAAVVGTLLVISTAGKIPILQGLVLAGTSAGAVGALLVTLPAVSAPGIVMVGRWLGWKTTRRPRWS